jgi:2,4-dienoyl-CoA reductase (NADPH2)
MSRLGDPLQLTAALALSNRFVATAHGSGDVVDGIPGPGDAEYWDRVASGGAGMVIGGGAVVAPESTIRRGNFIALWRPEVVGPLQQRADAIRRAGAVSIVQLLHLGRETLGADIYYAPVAPSAVRSPREPTAPRALTDAEIDALVEQFRAAAVNALAAGVDGFELHAAHGYLFGQFLSAVANRRADATTVDGRADVVWRVVDAVRALDPTCPIGIRLSVGEEHDAGLDLDALTELLGTLHPGIDYVNLTVGMRTRYVRDMATERPPLLDQLTAIRPATPLPLVVSQSFRDRADMEAALDAGADLVGMARPLIADPDLPRKLLAGRDRTVRPCVSCNEDCRTFDPVLLCTVNPSLGLPGESERRAAPLVRGAALTIEPRRVAVVGGGPAGLECALTLTNGDPRPEVVLFERSDRIGGALAVAASAPHRHGWSRLLEFYDSGIADAGVDVRLGAEPDAATLATFDAIVVATGSEEVLPDTLSGAQTVTAALAAGREALTGADHVVVLDDGFGWWPGVSAVELAIAAGVKAITLLTPGTGVAAGIPAESRVQLVPRLSGASLTVRPFATLTATGDAAPQLRDVLTGATHPLDADAVIAVGERRSRALPFALPEALPVIVTGDAIVPRRVAHAVAEGRAAARRLVAARSRTLAGVSR